ncbi:hypothetical protein H5V45_00890 [Nocardioides sp. KIGAM211]|uniref:Uncharacterized protein n=1 Tax=Nocardioides luti TaxID=2761101 RepID=A0A7X0RCM4_9ACTN|nr:hypothetical protein [Nocardioides luti]MBB6625863.1 hypothetical protein [Nocardioides luti]
MVHLSDPLTRERALAWARGQSDDPELRPYPHEELESDEVSGGWAFADGRRLYVAGRDGSTGVSLLGHRDPEDTIAAWLVTRRHANRTLAPDDLGPWQQAAVRAVERGVTVAALDDPRIATADDRDHADWIWLSLRRSRVAPLRALAANDRLMGPPQPPGRGGRLTHACPLCGRPAPHQERYPRAVCDDCHEATLDAKGRRVRGRNVSMSGGFEARFCEPLPGSAPGPEGDGGPCPEVTRSGSVWVHGHACRMGEARFGGIVVEAL